MNVGIVKILAGLIKPVSELIDNVTTSKDEKLQAKNKLQDLQNELLMKMLDYESELAKTKAEVLKSETMGSWLQRSWRPILMLTFGFIIVYEYFLSNVFGLPKSDLPEYFWDLLNIGLGGYVIGRSAEKIVPKMNLTNKNKANE